MLNNIKFSLYKREDTFLNKLDSFYKILYYFFFILMCTLTDKIVFHIFYLFWILFLIFISKIDIREYLKILNFSKIFLFSVFFINHIFGVSIIENILGILKIIEIFLYSFILMFTTTQLELIKGIRKLFTPLRVFHISVEEISLIFSLSIAFIPIILLQANKILKSLSIRGLEYKKSNIKEKLIIIQSMLVPMFVLSFKKADSIADMMEIRLYDNYLKCGKNVEKCEKTQKIKKLILVFHILLCISAFLMRW